MPKYWKEIAINAQEEASKYAGEARLLASERSPAWVFYATKAAALYSRARWAMSVPEDCP